MYRLAVGTNELIGKMRERAVEVIEIPSQKAIIDYVSTLGHFGPEDIVWN